jgi:preprotein translocase subunit SecB
MRFQEIIEAKNTNPNINYNLWKAQVQIKQPNYTGRIEVTVTAPNAQDARILMKAQYGVENWQIGSVQQVK